MVEHELPLVVRDRIEGMLGDHHPGPHPGVEVAVHPDDFRPRQPTRPPGTVGHRAMRLMPRRDGRGPEVQHPGGWARHAHHRQAGQDRGELLAVCPHTLGLHPPGAACRRPRLPHGRPGIRGDRLPPPPQRHHRRAGRHGREDPAAGPDAEPRWLRARPTARRGAGIGTTAAPDRSRGHLTHAADPPSYSTALCAVPC